MVLQGESGLVESDAAEPWHQLLYLNYLLVPAVENAVHLIVEHLVPHTAQLMSPALHRSLASLDELLHLFSQVLILQWKLSCQGCLLLPMLLATLLLPNGFGTAMLGNHKLVLSQLLLAALLLVVLSVHSHTLQQLQRRRGYFLVESRKESLGWRELFVHQVYEFEHFLSVDLLGLAGFHAEFGADGLIDASTCEYVVATLHYQTPDQSVYDHVPFSPKSIGV